jgi:hypothetical protein
MEHESERRPIVNFWEIFEFIQGKIDVQIQLQLSYLLLSPVALCG